MTTTTNPTTATELRAEIDDRRARLEEARRDETAVSRQLEDARRARAGARASGGGSDNRLARAAIRELESEAEEIRDTISLLSREITTLTTELRRAEGEESRESSSQRAAEAMAIIRDADTVVRACGAKVAVMLRRADAAGNAAIGAERDAAHRLHGAPMPMGHEQSYARSWPAYPGLRELAEEMVKYERNESRAHILAAAQRHASGVR